MRLTNLTLLAAAAFTVAGCAQAKDAVRFQAHDVTEYRGGYAVEVYDFNNDGRLDVVPNSTGNPTLMWYENPTWEPHVIVSDTRGIVNKAMGDLDGDGIPEVAIQSSFAMVAGTDAIRDSGRRDPAGRMADRAEFSSLEHSQSKRSVRLDRFPSKTRLRNATTG